MIQANEVTKTHGTVRAVDRVTFTAESGRVTAFLGPNGAGKTTTLRMIAGLAAPDSGSVLVDGYPIRAWARPAQALGSLIDEAPVHPSWTPEQHLRFLGLTHALSRTRVRQVMSQCGLDEFKYRPGKALSLGMRQRLGIAMARLGDARVLALDEPTSGLDPDGIRGCGWSAVVWGRSRRRFCSVFSEPVSVRCSADRWWRSGSWSFCC